MASSYVSATGAFADLEQSGEPLDESGLLMAPLVRRPAYSVQHGEDLLRSFFRQAGYASHRTLVMQCSIVRPGV